jgi:hypothetical protein
VRSGPGVGLRRLGRTTRLGPVCRPWTARRAWSARDPWTTRRSSPRRSSGQPVDEPAEPVDRALERRRHLERSLKRRQDRDQLGPGVDDLTGAVSDLAPARVDPVAEITHRVAKLEQLARPNVEALAERHDRLGPLVEPLRDEQDLAADLRDLLPEFHDPIKPARCLPGGSDDRADVVQDAADDRLR